MEKYVVVIYEQWGDENPVIISVQDFDSKQGAENFSDGANAALNASCSDYAFGAFVYPLLYPKTKSLYDPRLLEAAKKEFERE